jgi:hypothetical protein
MPRWFKRAVSTEGQIGIYKVGDVNLRLSRSARVPLSTMDLSRLEHCAHVYASIDHFISHTLYYRAANEFYNLLRHECSIMVISCSRSSVFGQLLAKQTAVVSCFHKMRHDEFVELGVCLDSQ